MYWKKKLLNKPKNQKKIIKQKIKRKSNNNIAFSKKRKYFKKKKINYSIIFNILIYVFLFISLFYVINIIYDFMLQKDFFILRDKKVENLVYLPKNTFYSIIDEYFKINYGDGNNINLFKINMNDIEKHILNSSDRIKKVDVNIIFPSTLNFFVEERIPLFAINKNNKMFFLDKSFYIFNILDNENIDYIILSGLDNMVEEKLLVYSDTETIINFIENLSLEEKNAISEIYFDSNNNIELFMNDLSLKIKLGKNDIIARFDKIKDIIKSINDDDVAYIDARFDKPVISFKKR